MNHETAAVLSAIPRHGKELTAAEISQAAGLPLWKTNCAISVLTMVYPGSIEAIAPKKKGPLMYRRTAEGDRLIGLDGRMAAE